MTVAREEPQAHAPVVPPPQVQLDDPDAAPLRDDARYSAGALIGEGGMGKVMLVRDRYVGRQVALKELKDDARGSSTSRARFEREVAVHYAHERVRRAS
jgi:hypothetical protein